MRKVVAELGDTAVPTKSSTTVKRKSFGSTSAGRLSEPRKECASRQAHCRRVSVRLLRVSESPHAEYVRKIGTVTPAKRLGIASATSSRSGTP